MNPIEIKGLCKSFGSTQVLKNLDLTIRPHEVVALIGESGCGKTTLFRSMEMLEIPDSGKIFINGQEITAKGVDIDKIRRSMGMVYQNFNLFTHMNVMDNLCLAPVRLLGMSRASAEEKANRLLDQVGLHGRGNQMPQELSGGQKQRVAIVRLPYQNGTWYHCRRRCVVVRSVPLCICIGRICYHRSWMRSDRSLPHTYDALCFWRGQITSDDWRANSIFLCWVYAYAVLVWVDC